MSARRLARCLAPAAWLALWCASVPVPEARAAEPSYPEPSGFVVDEADLLSEETRTRLTAVCAEVREKTGAEIGVAVVRSIAPVTVEEYAVRLFERWGVGSRERSEGVLLVVAHEERRVRIEVGYGLEGILPDGKVGGILRSDVVPHLRRDGWDAGVAGGVVALARVIAEDRGVTLASLEGEWVRREARGDRSVSTGFAFLVVLLVLLFAFGFLAPLIAVASRAGRRGRRRRGGAWPWIISGGSWGGGFGGGFGGGSSGGSGGGFGGFGGGFSGGGGASSGF